MHMDMHIDMHVDLHMDMHMNMDGGNVGEALPSSISWQMRVRRTRRPQRRAMSAVCAIRGTHCGAASQVAANDRNFGWRVLSAYAHHLLKHR